MYYYNFDGQDQGGAPSGPVCFNTAVDKMIIYFKLLL